MNSSESETAFLDHLAKPLEKVGVREGMNAMLDFYASQRAQDVVIEEDGDMLLYQWGVYDFEGPESFRVSITRQFISPEEDEPYQLKLTFHFEPTVEARAMQPGSRWCNTPKELSAYRKILEDSPALKFAANQRASKVDLDYGGC